MKLAPIAGSLVINVALLALLALLGTRGVTPPSTDPIEISIIDASPPAVATPLKSTPHAAPSGGGTPAHRPATRARSAPRAPEATRPWWELATRRDEVYGGDGGDRGDGGGIGGGHGLGIGLGTGNALIDAPALPALPTPPPPSRRRAAKLLHPSRETEVELAELFVARVTVDEDGDVVGAHMLRSHPGSRGEVADSMIWQFRYAPALDDNGNPVRSTFEQSFAVR